WLRQRLRALFAGGRNRHGGGGGGDAGEEHGGPLPAICRRRAHCSFARRGCNLRARLPFIRRSRRQSGRLVTGACVTKRTEKFSSVGRPLPSRGGLAAAARSGWGGRGVGSRGGGWSSGRNARFLHRRLRRPYASVAELETIAAQLVTPILALERPELLVVLDFGARPVRHRPRGIGRLLGQLLLAARDLEVETQRLTEQLAQLAPLQRDGGARAITSALQQVETSRPDLRDDDQRQRRRAEGQSAAIDRVQFRVDGRDLSNPEVHLGRGQEAARVGTDRLGDGREQRWSSAHQRLDDRLRRG